MFCNGDRSLDDRGDLGDVGRVTSVNADGQDYVFGRYNMFDADLVLQDFRKKGIRTVAEAEEMFKSAPKKPSYQKSVNSANMTGPQRTVQVPVREDKRIQTPSVKMRPCPFCGYDGIYLVIQNSTKFGTKYVLAECGQCEASTKSIGIHYDVADNVLAETIPEGRQAIDLWNARV